MLPQASPTPMEESFEGAEPSEAEADSSQIVADAEAPSPKRPKLSETKGDTDNTAETPPAESAPMDPLPTFIQE